MRPKGSPADLEARRRRAVALLEEGLGGRGGARQMGCSPTSVSRGQAEVRARGQDALRPKPTPGRPPRITPRQRAKLLKSLLRGARAHGFSTDLWTPPRGAEGLRFLQALRRHVPHGFTLIWDRHRPHRATCVTTWLAKYPRIVVEWLPAYAPDLNPVEPVWSP